MNFLAIFLGCYVNFLLFSLFFRKEFVSLPRLSQPCVAKAGQINIDGILRPTMPFVGQAKGGRHLRTLSFCVLKLCNFESVHRGNAKT